MTSEANIGLETKNSRSQEVPDFPGANRGRGISRSCPDVWPEVQQEVDLWELSELGAKSGKDFLRTCLKKFMHAD